MRKKIVFVIVEGPSDDDALGVILTRIFDNNKVYVHIMHGDITTMKGNVLNNIGNEIRTYAKSNHMKYTDFQQIIHIVDTDGAYIPENAVVENQDVDNPFYTLTGIHTKSVKNIQKRNAIKSGNLDRVSITKKVWQVPYKVYYMSCNLDHVLYNKPNSSDAEKEENSFEFAKKYKDDIPEFIKYMTKSEFSVDLEYATSWKYIKEGLRSLERHSNFGLCLKNSAESEGN